MRAEWSRLPKVDQVIADFEWPERLGRWVRFGNRVVGGFAALLGIAVGFIVGHLIRLQVLTRREEIEVSQLFGATAADVRRPFLYHGALQGFFAGALAVGLTLGLAAWVNAELRALATAYPIELKVISVDQTEVAAILAATVGLALAGAWLAVSRELRRFSRPA